MKNPPLPFVPDGFLVHCRKIISRRIWLAACLLAPVSLFAQTTYYWDVNGTAAGATSNGDGSASGLWTGNNWTTTEAGTSATGTKNNNNPGDPVVFSAGTTAGLATGASTITLGTGDVNINTLTIKRGTLTFNTGGSQFIFRNANALTLGPDADGSATFNVEIVIGAAYASQTWTNANTTAGHDLIFNNNVVVNVPSSLTLSNTSAGGTTVNGTLAGGSSGTTALSLVVYNPGTGVTTLTAANPYTGSTQVTAGTLVVSGGGSINQTSGVQLNHSTATLRYTSSVALTRTVTFGVNGGTFLYNSSAKYTGGGGSISADTGDTIGGNGVLGNVTIASGGTLTPGALGNNSIGNLTVDSLTLQTGSNASFDIASAVSFDSINSAGGKVMGGALYLNIASLLADGSHLALFTGGGALTGQFVSIQTTGAYGSQSFTWNSGPQTFTLSAQNQILTFDSTGVLSTAAVPEPTTALFLIAGMTLLFFRRRSFGIKSNGRLIEPSLPNKVGRDR